MATIVKRGSTYRVQIRRTGHPTLSKSGFRSHRDAAAWARAQEAKLDQGQRVVLGRKTFGDLLDAYRDHLDDTGGARRSKAQALRALKASLGDVRLDRLDVPLLTGWAAQRRKQGAGPATLLQDLSYIGTVLRHGAALSGADPTQALQALDGARRLLRSSGSVANPIERHRRPTNDELEQLFAHWRQRPGVIPMKRITRFCIATAMRLSEVCRLEWAELDADRRTILIRDRKHPRAKRGNDQHVPLLHVGDYDALALIDEQRAHLLEQEGRLGRFIFPYVAASVSTAFTRAVAACGIVDLHLHDLRHEGCSRLFEAGFTIPEVALVSGHRDWNMLRRYTQVSAEHVLRGTRG